jgi:predicted DNA-binding transcriptional regulator AlpA
MKTEFMLLALYEKPFLNFEEICKAIGIAKQTGYNLRSQNAFPIPLLESPVRAHVQDVAEYIDQLRDQAKEKVRP